MDFTKEELVSEFRDFLKETMNQNPDINMEDFIHRYFDLLVYLKVKLVNIPR